jgi:putative copper export protein
MKAYLITINNFVHDLFTGLWISTIIVICLLEQKAGLAQETLAEALKEIMRSFFWLGICFLLVTMITGVCRYLYYRSADENISGTLKKRLLISKHILLGSILFGGTYLAYRFAFG